MLEEKPLSRTFIHSVDSLGPQASPNRLFHGAV